MLLGSDEALGGPEREGIRGRFEVGDNRHVPLPSFRAKLAVEDKLPPG